MAEAPTPPAPPPPPTPPSSCPPSCGGVRPRHHRSRRSRLPPGVADYNVHHRNILANSSFNLSSEETLVDDTSPSYVRSPAGSGSISGSSSCSSSQHEAQDTEIEEEEEEPRTPRIFNSPSAAEEDRILFISPCVTEDTSPNRVIPPVASPWIPQSVIPPPPSLDGSPPLADLNPTDFCRASLNSVETYPPRHPRPYHRNYWSEDSHRTVPKRRTPRRRLSGTPFQRPGISPSTLKQGHSPGIPSSAGNSPSVPPYSAITSQQAAPESNKMYLETKINMLEIIQSGLQLKLDLQCVKEQFLSLLETYSFAEQNFLHRPCPVAGPRHTDTMSAGRARVRALYDQRRARIQSRREKFAQEMAAATANAPLTPRSSRRRNRVPPTCTVTSSSIPPQVSQQFASSEGLSDSTFDDWELKSVSSGDVLDAEDCSNHRHNNSPNSEGTLLNSSPDSEIPAGHSSTSGGGNTTTSSDGTSIITKLLAGTAVDKVDKENVKPEHYEDAKNNNLGERGDNVQKLQSITEERMVMVTDSTQEYNTLPAPTQESHDNISTASAAVLPQNSDLRSFCSEDMHMEMDIDMDENGYVIMKGLDPSIMDFNMADMYEGAGEAYQSRFSGFSDFSQEISRKCHNSYRHSLSLALNESSAIPAPAHRDTSIPIYTARNSIKDKDVEGEYVMLKSPFADAGDYVTLIDPTQQTPRHRPSNNRSMMSFYDQLEPSMLMPYESHATMPWSVTNLSVTGRFGRSNIITESQVESPNTSPRKGSPKYATSETIKELYTKDRSLKDISNISRISRGGLHDSTFGDSTIGNMLGFISPESYPLNSTMKTAVSNVVGNNTMAHSVDDSDDTLENIADDELPPPPPPRSFHPTSFSDSNAIMYHAPEVTQCSMNQSMNDSFLDNCEPGGNHQMDYNTDDFVTPKRNLPKKPQLCNEHGLHPAFGGPCLFDTLDSSTEEDESISHSTDKSRSSRSTRSNKSKVSAPSTNQYAADDTDCDSSYLSECVDDTANTTQDIRMHRDSDRRYTYDSRTASMTILRRQTGQSNIQKIKPPIGLSETDLHHDISRKHLSLEATRNSLPDLSNLSLPPSDNYDDLDSTLIADNNSKNPRSARKTQHPNVLLHKHGIPQGQGQGRPLSISTVTTATTDESPESTTTGIPVPVNSPNATDSGSSRPTTDNYDYVDLPATRMPAQFDTRMPPPRFIPPRRRPVGSSFVEPPVSGRQYSPIGQNSSVDEPKPKRNISGSLGNIPMKKSHLRSSQDSLDDPGHPGHRHHHRSQHSLHQQRARSGHRSEGVESRSSSRNRQNRYPRSTDSGVETLHYKTKRRGLENVAGGLVGAPSVNTPFRGGGPSPSYTSAPAAALGYNPEEGMTSRARRLAQAEPPLTSQNITKERKKVLAKKLKQFSNNFYNSTGNLQNNIKTLGHF